MTQTNTNWEETTLGEIIETNKSSIGKDFEFDEILYLDTGSITENRIEQLQNFNISEAPSRAKRLVKENDIIYSTVRPNQKHFGYVKNPKKNLIVSTGFTVISIIQNKADSKFLYYFITQDKIINYLQQIAEHSTSTYPSIRPEDIENLPILLPPLPEQKAIASVLSSLDDKIELLREENKTLESLAQTIFHEQFGKYRPTEPLPEGWRVGKLSEIAEFLNGIALQKYPPENETEYLPVVKIRELKAGITNQTDKASKNIDSKYIINDGDVLFSWSGSLEVVIWQHGKGALNQHLFKVSSEKYPKWFYYYWTLYHLSEFREIASNKATTMGHIQRHHLNQAEVIIPNDNTMQKINSQMSPILNKIMLINQEIQSLACSRDELLPKLMSSLIRVNDSNNN